MNDIKKNSKLLNVLIITPSMLHNFIFVCFRFADWRKELADGIQFGILVGALAITVSFLSYYGVLFYIILKYYKEDKKVTYLLTILLMILLCIGSFLVGYFLTYHN